jgi:cytochrome c-type biogenesis protein CcmH
MRRLAVAAIALALVPAAAASERHPTLGELEGEVICPTCHTTLDQSDAPIAQQMKAYIAAWIRAGDTKSEIERKLVAQFGPQVLAEPSKHGFDLLAWLLPISGLLAGAAILGAATWRWTRPSDKVSLGSEPTPPLDAELERRVDEELARFEN